MNNCARLTLHNVERFRHDIGGAFILNLISMLYGSVSFVSTC